jgi:lipoate-protein ligase A
LRFYRWQPSAVSIGKNQYPEAEVYLDACKRLGVEVVRRMSGGGTVYHDYEGEVTYGVIAKTGDLGTADVTTVYAKIYEAIKGALGLLGIEADFSSGDAKNCPNMTVGGKKISGSSQAITRGVVLQHGTVLRSVDLTKMFTLLKLKNATCSQAVDIAKRKITSVENELGHSVAPEMIAEALINGFESVSNIHFEQGALTSSELEIAEHLFKEKYATIEWTFQGRTP